MGKKTILVCDDEPHILHVVSMKLRNAGYDVLCAEDGREALALAQEHLPDAIVTDYQMPELSGLELCARLRGEPDTATIPIIMLTARGFDLCAEAVEAANIQDVLAKPFSPREVLQKVNACLGVETTAHA